APVVGRRGHRMRLGRDLREALLLDLRDVQLLHPGARRRGYRANAAAPPGPDDSHVDLLHWSSHSLPELLQHADDVPRGWSRAPVEFPEQRLRDVVLVFRSRLSARTRSRMAAI